MSKNLSVKMVLLLSLAFIQSSCLSLGKCVDANCRSAPGKILRENGDVFIGRFEFDGTPFGPIRVEYADGSIFEGQFRRTGFFYRSNEPDIQPTGKIRYQTREGIIFEKDFGVRDAGVNVTMPDGRTYRTGNETHYSSFRYERLKKKFASSSCIDCHDDTTLFVSFGFQDNFRFYWSLLFLPKTQAPGIVTGPAELISSDTHRKGLFLQGRPVEAECDYVLE